MCKAGEDQGRGAGGVPSSILYVLDGSGKIRAEVGWKLRGEDGGGGGDSRERKYKRK